MEKTRRTGFLLKNLKKINKNKKKQNDKRKQCHAA